MEVNQDEQSGHAGGTSALDVSQIESHDPEFREFPQVQGSRGDGFQIIIKRSVRNEIRQHGRSSPAAEICGVLVGRPYRDAAGSFLVIDGSIRGTHADSQIAQVTFTAETWTHIQQEMDAKYPNEKIIGWYHTHPGFGIFLSEMDTFIHRNFFNLPWQIAWVYDPLNEEEGVFIWRDDKPSRHVCCIENDVSPYVASAPAPPVILKAGAGVDPTTVSARLSQLEQGRRTLWSAWIVLLVVAVVWPAALNIVLVPKSIRLYMVPKNSPELSKGPLQPSTTGKPVAPGMSTDPTNNKAKRP